MVRVERREVGGYVRLIDHLYCDECGDETAVLITGSDLKDRCPDCHQTGYHYLAVEESYISSSGRDDEGLM